jgi:hypothetical protein
MSKFYVKAGFSKLKDSELVMRANTIISSLTDNEAYPTPNPALEIIQSSLDDFQHWLNTIPTGNRADTVMKNQSRSVLLDLLKRLGYHVNEVAEDFVDLFSSGFPIANFPNRVNAEIPSIPRGLVLRDGKHSGKIRLDFNPVKEARLYLYRHGISVDGTTKWEASLPSTSSRNNVIEGLSPGTEYLVQAKSVNSAGYSDWSDSVKLIAR